MSDVVMPQMGESIAEGTIVRWIKKVGDRVDRDEPLFEISTDKVDAEIPSPSAGVLTEIRAKEGETVPVNFVVAVIGDAAAAAVAPPAAASAAAAHSAPSSAPAPQPAAAAVPAPAAAAPVVAEPEIQASLAGDELRRQKSSPLVRKIAAEHHVNIAQIPGTGLGGRVTKHDILGFLGTGLPAGTASHAPAASAPVEAALHTPVFKAGDHVELVPMSVMRRKIAEHMVLSRRTSAHVHSVFEIDYTRVAKIRAAKKADYEK
ncbi:MAG: biotin/lipoyl-containing protein, partial [Acidobacteriota bacterium]